MERAITDRSFRLPVKLLVKFDGSKFEGNYFIENLSSGGLFIETGRPAPVGTKLQVEFVLPHNEDKKNFEAEVCWNREASKTDQLSPGMGIKFINISEEETEYLRSVIDQYRMIME